MEYFIEGEWWEGGSEAYLLVCDSSLFFFKQAKRTSLSPSLSFSPSLSGLVKTSLIFQRLFDLPQLDWP